MNPLRWDVLGVAFLLALPLLALWYRGDLALDDVTARLPWCFVAGWAVLAVLRWATTPRRAAHAEHDRAHGRPHGGAEHHTSEDTAASD